MESAKFLKIVIIILLLINIATLGFMFMQRPHGMPPPPMDAGDFISHELNFSPEQINQLNKLREASRMHIDELREKGKGFHDKYFDLLSSDEPGSVPVLQLADSIASNQKEIELITFSHFKDVRAICTPDQQKRFDSIINDALRMMAPKGRPGR